MENERIYEAIFIFDKYCVPLKNKNNASLYTLNSSLPDNILNATLRLLAAYNLLTYKDKSFYATEENLLAIRQLILKKGKHSEETANLFDKINQKKEGSFFDNISDLEYEIYARCNYEISYEIGQSLCRIHDFGKASVLDIGGNSGGLANAILKSNTNCEVTVVDTSIPCAVGYEFKKLNNVSNIEFVEGDFFSLELNEQFDYIILSNVLHDFSDMECKEILKGCKKHTRNSSKIIIIEDILNSEIEPIKVLEYGLRLSVNTYKGKQRTVEELNNLLSQVSFSIIKKAKINDVQSAIIYELS
jgi:2-polyprenyl-3-methyl-5-hydroxy-6-metoxy-1,4-benzoquinol methylase